MKKFITLWLVLCGVYILFSIDTISPIHSILEDKYASVVMDKNNDMKYEQGKLVYNDGNGKKVYKSLNERSNLLLTIDLLTE